MSALYILSNRFVESRSWDSATPEMVELREEAESRGVECIPAGPDRLAFVAPSGGVPSVFISGVRVEADDGLIVRSLGEGYYELGAGATAIAKAQGSFCADPVERFRSGSASKTSTTFARSASGVGSDSIILARRNVAAAAEEVEPVLEALALTYPLVVKPSQGRQGRGVSRVDSVHELLAAVRGLAGDEVLIQPLEAFVAEYRVLMLRDVVLGVAEKISETGSVTANAATGGTFRPVDVDARATILAAVRAMPISSGFVGLDVARTDDGQFRLIEENYSPQWLAFSAATGVNVSGHLMDLFFSERQPG